MKTKLIAAGALVVATALLATGGSAQASSLAVADGTTTPGPMDIHRLTVANGDRLTVAIKVADLQPKPGRSAAAWIDTNPQRPGPEFRIGSGLFDSDWQITRVRDWKATQYLNCPITQTLRYADNLITWRTGAACLGDYSRVRVSVTTWWAREVDNAPGPRRFTSWVPRNTGVAAADSPGCVTGAEYRQISRGMTKARVHQIFDTAGQFGWGGAGGYSRTYRHCRATTPGRVTVEYSTLSGRSRVAIKSWSGGLS